MKKNRSFILSLLFACALCVFQCSDEEEAPKSALGEIVSFKLSSLSPEVIGTIDDAGKKITLVVPHGTDLAALTPVIEVSEKATISPASGVAQDFSTPVTYTVTAESGSTQEYLATVTAETICLPTTLPAEEADLKITYTHNTDGTHTINNVEFLNFDAPEPGKFIAKFNYTDGKLSRIDHLADNEVVSYLTFEDLGGQVVENRFNKLTGGDFQKANYYVYYLEDSRISGWGYHDVNYGYSMRDSMAFTYNNAGNIVHADRYNFEKVKEYTVDYEYDDKPNPYHLAGINEADNEFYTPLHLSVNNVTKATIKYLSPVSEEIEITSYTYDAAGNPITRSASWDDATRDMAYTCH